MQISVPLTLITAVGGRSNAEYFARYSDQCPRPLRRLLHLAILFVGEEVAQEAHSALALSLRKSCSRARRNVHDRGDHSAGSLWTVRRLADRHILADFGSNYRDGTHSDFSTLRIDAPNPGEINDFRIFGVNCVWTRVAACRFRPIRTNHHFSFRAHTQRNPAICPVDAPSESTPRLRSRAKRVALLCYQDIFTCVLSE